MINISSLAKELNIGKEEVKKYFDDKGYKVKKGNVDVKRRDLEGIKQDLLTNKKEEKKEVVKDDKKYKIVSGSTVKEFAEALNKNPSEIVSLLFNLGETVTINQVLSDEEIHIIANELGADVEVAEDVKEEKKEEKKIPKGKQVPRSPVVTVMGHVDHGKTKLLDALRKTDVVSSESGGITQHIGAYQIKHNKKKITFIDTPGHEAFTAMRARGAKVTDVAILVVAADDGVKPQTIEAIDHAKAAGVPIVVAVNKIDKENANPEKVRQQLSKYDLSPEEWGGKTVFVDVSAKKEQNLNDLIEMIILVSDMQELKAVLETPAEGVVIEAKIDKGRGPVATVLVQHGKLKIGDSLISGVVSGKVRSLFNDRGEKVKEVFPGEPIEVVGFKDPPDAGDIVNVVEDERKAKEITNKRALKERIIREKEHSHLSLDDLHKQIEEGKIKDLNLVVKADVQGSIEALEDSLKKLDQKEVRVKVIHSGVGAITETDVMLATASNAVLVGFNVRPDAKAKQLAEKEEIDIRTYKIIYQLIEDIDAAMIGMLEPKIVEVVNGEAEIRETFKLPKIGIIAGCFVNQGNVSRNDNVRVIREGVVINETKLASLKRFKNDVNEVKEGYECGIGLENFQDIKQGDILEFYIEKEQPREK